MSHWLLEKTAKIQTSGRQVRPQEPHNGVTVESNERPLKVQYTTFNGEVVTLDVREISITYNLDRPEKAPDNRVHVTCCQDGVALEVSVDGEIVDMDYESYHGVFDRLRESEMELVE